MMRTKFSSIGSCTLVSMLVAFLSACSGEQHGAEELGVLKSALFGSVDVDTAAGSNRNPTNDSSVIGASASGCTEWHVDVSGSDTTGTGTDTSRWKTLHHAMAAVSAISPAPSCGKITVHYSSTAYPGRSGVSSDPVELMTSFAGASSTQNFVIKGEPGAGGERPRIVVDSDRVFLTIAHSNWKIDGLDIDFRDDTAGISYGGRGISVTAGAQDTENVVVTNTRIHRIRGCNGEQHPSNKAEALFSFAPTTVSGWVKNLYVIGNTFDDNFRSRDSTSCSTSNEYRDDGFGVLIWPKTKDVLIKDNIFKNVSADGVQCAGRSGNENAGTLGEVLQSDTTEDPYNIEIVENRLGADS